MKREAARTRALRRVVDGNDTVRVAAAQLRRQSDAFYINEREWLKPAPSKREHTAEELRTIMQLLQRAINDYERAIGILQEQAERKERSA